MKYTHNKVNLIIKERKLIKRFLIISQKYKIYTIQYQCNIMEPRNDLNLPQMDKTISS